MKLLIIKQVLYMPLLNSSHPSELGDSAFILKLENLGPSQQSSHSSSNMKMLLAMVEIRTHQKIHPLFQSV